MHVVGRNSNYSVGDIFSKCINDTLACVLHLPIDFFVTCVWVERDVKNVVAFGVEKNQKSSHVFIEDK